MLRRMLLGRMLLATNILTLSYVNAWAQLSFSEAIGTMGSERTLAEDGASLLKRYASDDFEGRSLYAKAKAASDELIEQLLADLAQRRDPKLSESLRAKIEQAVERRLMFSQHVDTVMKRVFAQGAKPGWADALAVGAGELVKQVMLGGVAIWREGQSASAERRRDMATRLEAQRWNLFANIQAAR